MNLKGKRKPLSAAAVQHIQGELRKLDATGRVLRQGGRTFVKCPFHNEKTPSCIVTTQTGKFEVGSFKCLGCGEAGGWNQLAEAMNLAPVGDDVVAKTVQEYDTKFYDSMLQERYVSYKGLLDDLEVAGPEPVEENTQWRTLPGNFLNSVKACRVKGSGWKNKGEPYLFLPNYMNGELVGAVRAVMVDSGDKSVVKYKNSSGPWSRGKGLYPYDPVARSLDKFQQEYGFRGLALVEGARDSLCLNCEGIPTLGLLGTQSWCAAKMDNIWDLEPDFVLVCMDGDRSGREAEEKIWEEIRKLAPCRKMNLTRYNKEAGYEVDPGNAPEGVISEIWKTLHRRKPQS